MITGNAFRSLKDQPHCIGVAEIAGALDTDAERGLTETEAGRRLVDFGRNELISQATLPAWQKLLAQFSDVLVLLLIGAALISGVLWFFERDSDLPYEAFAVFGIVLLNAIMGFSQQSRAEQAVAALRNMSAAHATVVRNGTRLRLPSAELVPGDVILIQEGDTIPADARLILSIALQTAEAALTGESLPVSKEPDVLREDAPLGDRRNMVFSGTAATYGRGCAIVTATGMSTEMGRIAGMLKRTPDEPTPLQRELDRVGQILGAAVIVIAVVIIATILLVGEINGIPGLFDVLILGVALAVAAVPEGLPAVVTAVLSLGVQRMAAQKAIIRNLSAVETLGSANVIASDKTGTLTKNEMTVRRIATASGCVTLTGTGYSPEGNVRDQEGRVVEGALHAELLRTLSAADRANNAVLQEQDGRWFVHGDPTEGALIVAARKVGLTEEGLNTRFPRLGEVPFSSERKLMSTVCLDAEHEQTMRAFTKGAPDGLLGRCSRELIGVAARPLTTERRGEILGINDQLAGDALRTLGVAFRSLRPDTSPDPTFDGEIEHDLVFLGLIGMIDPPREAAKKAVERAWSAGVRPIMITGDHPRTAAVIAIELGISKDGQVMTGAQIESLSQTELDRTVGEVSVYARVNPDHKLRIVHALQRCGLTVAMTGDGVNDAPALKTADIGVAMGITGTDVSKEAADMVLADDNFASIVAAVEEGRAVFSNIRKFLRYLLSSNIGEVMTMFSGILLADVIGLRAAGEGSMVLPLAATQILWINLVTDGAPALALGVDPADPAIMNKPPRPRGESVITSRMWAGIFFVGAIMAAGTIIVLDVALPGGFFEGSETIPHGQTMAFTTLTMFQLFNVFNARSDDRSAVEGLIANHWLWGAIALSVGLHVLVIYVPFLQAAFSTVPLSLGDWLTCAVVASSVLWLRELSKFVQRRLTRMRERSST